MTIQTWTGVTEAERTTYEQCIITSVAVNQVPGQPCLHWADTLPPPARAASQVEPTRPRLQELSEREVEVTRLLGSGHSAKEAAAVLGISMKTVDNHRQNAMRKLGLKCRAEMVLFAVRNGLVQV